MMDANEVLKVMCEKYQAAVNANDSAAYRQLFAADAIRIRSHRAKKLVNLAAP